MKKEKTKTNKSKVSVELNIECMIEADTLLEAVKVLKEKFGDDLNVIVNDVNPTIGSHCGPDAIGICFHAKHR